MRIRLVLGGFVAALALLSAQQTPPPAGAQTQTPPTAGRGRGGGAAPAGGGGGGGFANAFPQHAQADAASIERGKALYGVHCTFCHGSDVRGGEGGPNLLRSQLVLNDKNGEGLTQIVQNGRPDAGMPKFDLNAAQISDIAAYIHSFRVAGYDDSRQKPISILVGDAKAGDAYFKAKCASCHSVTGDLQGFAGKIADPRALQQAWLMPGVGRGGRGIGGNVPPTTVAVTMTNGQKIEGRLLRIDDFLVTLIDANGNEQSIRRDGATPKVEVHDPLDPHRELLRVYSDKDIHNVTAYLVTLK